MAIEIAPLDPADAPTVAAVQELRVAADGVDIPDFPPPCPYEFRGALEHPPADAVTDRFVARLDGAIAGYLTVERPLRENLDNADVVLSVHPALRRRGVGRAMHGYLLGWLREQGRKVYHTGSVEALPEGPPRPAAGREFAVAVGAAAALDEVRSRLDLTEANEPALAALASEAQARATGYELVTWGNYVPDEYAADVGHLNGRLVADAPLGDLTIEPPVIDVARLREAERIRDASGWRLCRTGAVHRDSGRLVAITALAQQQFTPWHAFQWITLVDAAHRGHRLGALVKVANLRHIQAQEPELRVIDTWNAAVNRHMRAINEAMGFRPVDRLVNWQREV